MQLIDNPFSIDILLRWSKGAAILFLKGQKLYIPLIGYKEAQSNRMGYKEAQSNRMYIIWEGIECLVTKTLHTRLYYIFAFISKLC